MTDVRTFDFFKNYSVFWLFAQIAYRMDAKLRASKFDSDNTRGGQNSVGEEQGQQRWVTIRGEEIFRGTRTSVWSERPLAVALHSNTPRP